MALFFTRASATHARTPVENQVDEFGTTMRSPIETWGTIAGTHLASASQQAQADPPLPPGPDGWSPATVTPVHSSNPQGFAGAALTFAIDPVAEPPGQRLSTAMIDDLAPYYAATFGVDEQFVRDRLAEVYLYVGGPATGGSAAMTIGQHIFLPTDKDLRHIVSPAGRHWLTHELSHTMQFLVYSHGNAYRFLGNYITASAVGYNPKNAGGGERKPVWGAIFTGWRMIGKSDGELGKPSLSLADKLAFSVMPAAAIGLPVGLTAGGGLAALAALNRYGSANHLSTGMAIVTAPMIAGAAVGVSGDKVWHIPSQFVGAAVGAGSAALLLTALGRTPGPYLSSKLFFGGALALAAGLGYATSAISANTIAGWSRTAEVTRQVHAEGNHAASTTADRPFSLALHDAHWEEIEAEAIADRHSRDPKAANNASAFTGVIPDTSATAHDRLTWGVSAPLIIGIPAAVGAGATLFTGRTGTAIARNLLDGNNPFDAVVGAFQTSGSQGRSLLRCVGQGAALTIAPLVVGGSVAGISDELGWTQTGATIAGTAAAALVGGGLMTLLTGRPGAARPLLARTPAVLASTAFAGAVGFLAASMAARAGHNSERAYRIPDTD
jgi:hypothetical protein